MGIGVAFTGFSQVPIYEQNFDFGQGGWVIDNAANGSWEHGAPAGTIINSAASGNFAFVTNLTGNYNTNEDGNVTSPAIDITSATGNEVLSMNVWYDAEFSWDGANIFASYDGGTTWNIVGDNGDPDNWYNDNSISGAPNGSTVGWSGDNDAGSGSNGWVLAMHGLDSAMMVDSASLMLRVGFGSDASEQWEGFAFDDVKVAEAIRVDLSATNIDMADKCSYTAIEPVIVDITNIGDTTYNTGAIIPVNYSIDGGAVVTENIVLAADLATDSVVTYTFAALADLSAPGVHIVRAWPSYPSDLQTGNDTTAFGLFNSTAVIPYFEDFEAGANGWLILNGANGTWDFGTPAGATINNAASGVNAFVTNLTGDYNSSENSNVISSCIDITAATGEEVLTMKAWWDIETTWDGASVFTSIDNGATWDNVENFEGDGNDGSSGWYPLEFALDSAMMVDNSTMLVRVGFGSDASEQFEGFAFDDIAIAEPTATYEYGVAGIDSLSECLAAATYTLDAGPGYAFYHWADVNDDNFGGTWSNAQTLDITATGTYEIIVADAAGRIARDTVYIELKDFTPPSLVDVVNCTPGDSAMFDAGSGTTPANIVYTWSNGDTTQTSWLFTTGSITVTKNDTALGCSAMSTAIFTDEPIFSLRGDTTVCEGTSVLLDPQILAGYLWSDGSTGPTLTVDAAATYTLTVTDGNGCSGTDSFILTNDTLPVVDLGEDGIFCTGSVTPSAPLDAGAATSYLWSDGSTNQTFTPSLNGYVDVTVTDANGCMGSDTVLLIVETCVGVNEVSNTTEVKMYPNPTQGNLTIKLANFNEDVVMNVLTVFGQVVRAEKLTSATTVLDLNDLSEGTYILQLKSENSVSVNKFIINR